MSPPDAARPSSGRTARVDEVEHTVDGRLDLRGSERLRALLDDAVAPRRRVVLDLSAVDHVSSAALAVLVSGHRRLRDGGGELVVRSPSAPVVRELRISGLHRVIQVEGDVEGAVRLEVGADPAATVDQEAGTTTSS